MGCGSSKVQGDEQTGATGDALQPIKKVHTNFSTVDYDAAGKGRRDTTVGPLDSVQQKSDALPPLPETEDSHQSAALTADPAQPETKTTKADQINFENRIPDQQPTAQDLVTHHIEDAKAKEPYQDVTASPTTPTNTNTFNSEGQVSQTQITSATADKQGDTQDIDTNMGFFSKSKKSSGTTPEFTSDTSKSAATDEGTSTSTPQSFGLEKQSNEDKPRKKSLYQKYQDLRRGPGTTGLSDDEYKKYTGKTREELNAYAQTTPGVAGGQAAGSLTAGGTSGIGMAGGAGEGLGGWGFGAGKQPTVR